jgi:hypothetical protein
MSLIEGSKQLRDRILFEIWPKPLYIGGHNARISARFRSTLELEAIIACTNPPPPEAIGPGEDLEERTGKLENPSFGPEDLG